ncbi:phosphodiesterase [Comamonas antarctica]|uniref:HD-GYP domain-containing protein n=1 Tax=Comamonas antarctica TaxID=2743470 RepID=UPI0028ECB984|nr:phosphodiesterase [Comamonas antarctica]
MSHTLSAPTLAADQHYEDLRGLWAELEAALALLLGAPLQVQNFAARLRQLGDWLQELVAHDSDAALYLMFQLAADSAAGYSASHALVTATLCQVLAPELELPAHERQALVSAAFTMNIGMTRLQDQLALQREPPTAAQRAQIERHPLESQALLVRLFVDDPLWLEAVGAHHPQGKAPAPLAQLAAGQRLARILAGVDRYAAMLSPRKSRSGRSATDSVRVIVGSEPAWGDEVGYALVRRVGLCPPGTLVRLDNGDTAVVLRRSSQPLMPLVARVLDASGQPFKTPALHDTARGAPRIEAALARSALAQRITPLTLALLGVYVGRSRPAPAAARREAPAS